MINKVKNIVANRIAKIKELSAEAKRLGIQLGEKRQELGRGATECAHKFDAIQKEIAKTRADIQKLETQRNELRAKLAGIKAKIAEINDV